MSGDLVWNVMFKDFPQSPHWYAKIVCSRDFRPLGEWALAYQLWPGEEAHRLFAESLKRTRSLIPNNPNNEIKSYRPGDSTERWWTQHAAEHAVEVVAKAWSITLEETWYSGVATLGEGCVELHGDEIVDGYTWLRDE